jgi:predicted acyltransferase
MPEFPIIKKVWTSSFALTTGGISLVLLALFYWIIDVRGWSKWAIPFVVIGMNPLLIYLLAEVVDFEGIAGYFLNGPLHGSAEIQALGIAIGSLSAKWLLLFFLYKQKVFVKI